MIAPLIEKIKKEGKGRDHDCLIGLSGGVDSSYVAYIAKEKFASVHMPMIGSGQAGGNWSIILEMIKETLSKKGIEVTIHELPNQKQLKGQQQSLHFSE